MKRLVVDASTLVSGVTGATRRTHQTARFRCLMRNEDDAVDSAAAFRIAANRARFNAVWHQCPNDRVPDMLSCDPGLMNDGINRVPFSAMTTGLHQAVERFKTASTGSDPVASAIPLFEALNWAVALDERVMKDWAPDGVNNQPGWDWPARLTNESDAEAVRGIRFVRNRVHHQWADAIRLAQGGSRYPPQAFQWVWVQANELPAPDAGHHKRGRKGYECLLENRPADFTLAILDETYHFVVQLLEPLGPTARWRHNAQTG